MSASHHQRSVLALPAACVLVVLFHIAAPPWARAAAPAASDGINLASLRLGVADLAASFPNRYPHGPELLRQIDAYARSLGAARKSAAAGDASGPAREPSARLTS